MAAGTVAAVAKKVLAMVVSDKKGRKFLGYVIGITIFIVLLPVIMLAGMFGWLSGGNEITLNKDDIYKNMPLAFHEQISKLNSVCEEISEEFAEKGMTVEQINLAQSIYMSCLVGKEESATFYDDLVRCFTEALDEKDIFDNVEKTFNVTFTERDIEQITEIFKKKNN